MLFSHDHPPSTIRHLAPMLIDRLSPRLAEDNPLWLVVLCDLMTNLMLFFLVLFSFSRMDVEEREKTMAGIKEGFAGAPETPSERRAPEALERFQEREAVTALDEYLKSRKLKAGIEVNEAEIRVDLPSPVLFGSGISEITKGAREELSGLARILAKIPKGRIFVEGHTDTVPIPAGKGYASNWHLSAARAERVARVLEAGGVPAKRIVVAGYGEYRPAAPNDSAQGRAANRRIEIRVLRRAGKRVDGR